VPFYPSMLPAALTRYVPALPATGFNVMRYCGAAGDRCHDMAGGQAAILCECVVAMCEFALAILNGTHRGPITSILGRANL